MHVLTLWQPWATLIALSVKTIETRSWPAPKSIIGQRIAIHAAARIAGMERTQRWPIGEYEVERDDPRGCSPSYLLRGPIAWPYRLPLGVIVATATVTASLEVRAWHGNATDDFIWLISRQNGIEPSLSIERSGRNERFITDQLPYGDFTPGRFGWLLTDIEPLTKPEPFQGGQGLSRTWEPT